MGPTNPRNPGPPMAANADNPGAALADLRILIVEDIGLIAQQLRRQLEDQGCRIAGVVGRLDDAIALAQSVEIDGALLDLNLSGRESYPVADILRARDIPFIFLSGYDSGYLRAEYAAAPHLQKPYTSDVLRSLLITTFVPRLSSE